MNSKIEVEVREPAKNFMKPGKGILINSIEVSDQVKKELLVLLRFWSGPLNFKSYTKGYFPAELYAYNQSEEVDHQEFPEFAQIKNSLINQEIKAINARFSELIKIFEKYHISVSPYVIASYLKQHRSEPENGDFLKILREKTLNLAELELLIRDKLVDITFEELIHYCAIIYLDLFKMRIFLLSNFTSDVTDVPIRATGEEDLETNNSTASKKLSALETAYLAHYLVESKEYTFINGTPGGMDWEYFSKITNGTSPTNIRKSYGEIIKTDERLKPSRVEKIKNVISYLNTFLPDHQGAIQKAKQELQIVEQKPH